MYTSGGAQTCCSKHMIDHHLAQTSDRVVDGVRDEHTLACSEPAGLEHGLEATCLDVLDRLFDLFRLEYFEPRSGDVMPRHEVLGKCFGALHAGGQGRRTKDGDAH